MRAGSSPRSPRRPCPARARSGRCHRPPWCAARADRLPGRARRTAPGLPFSDGISADSTRETAPARFNAFTVADSVSPLSPPGEGLINATVLAPTLTRSASPSSRGDREAQAEVVVRLALDAHRIDMHRQGDGAQHLAVEIAEVRARPGDIAGRAGHRHRGARWRHRQPRSRIEQLFQLALDFGPRVVIRLGRNRLAGEVAAAVSGGAVLGRGRYGVALRAGQRVNLKHRGTAAHDLDRLPVRS